MIQLSKRSLNRGKFMEDIKASLKDLGVDD
jgi:hypothetical protein